ncbi:hypothetical protein ABZ721_37065 [Streptomyces sp. NPDC006733]|uniref:hypothetical protein n=1 Tax=Streptomyces sp. NPDC006733 TaxID=3155460 RepID=UPI0033CA3F41
MTSPGSGYDDSDDDVAALRQLGESVLGLRFDGVEQAGGLQNMLGLRSRNILFSRRLDSLTYFVQDDRFGVGRELGVFEGSDEELLRSCRAVLSALGVPESEIAHEGIVCEQTQVARFDAESGRAELEEPEPGNRYARVGRYVEDRPVWQSGCLLGLTADRQIGYLQLHWPELPGLAVEEMQALARRVDLGWRPPDVEGAEPESMEAGITHSAAVGFLLDIYPAIRVVYAPTTEGMGRKPVRYLNRYSEDLPAPRTHAWDLDQIAPSVTRPDPAPQAP